MCVFTLTLAQNRTLFEELQRHNATTFLRLADKAGFTSILQNPNDGKPNTSITEPKDHVDM